MASCAEGERPTAPSTSPGACAGVVLDRIRGSPRRARRPTSAAITPDTRGATTIREQLASTARSNLAPACHTEDRPAGLCGWKAST